MITRRRRRSITLRGSRRPKPAGAKLIGPVAANEPLAVWLYLKNPAAKNHPPGSKADLEALTRPITRSMLARQRAREFAPAVALIRKFVKKHRLKLRRFRADRRCIIIAGSAGRLAKAFGTALHIYDDGQQRFRGRSGSLKVPPSIARWTRAVHGFDHRPQVTLQSLTEAGAGAGLWPSDVAELYGIPLDPVGPQQCIGIVALGGGYLPSDMAQAAAAVNRAAPTIVEHSVNGAGNQYGGGTRADEEIALDMQVIGGIVPAAKIVIYFAQNNIASLAAAVHDAVFDDVNRPSVLSISWGSAEKFWQPGPRETMQSALADAVTHKVSVIIASGDFLATAGVTDGAAHVTFPSSSPYALGCGGTNITIANGAITSEVVWKDNFTGTGGGISDFFAVPEYQSNLAIPVSVSTGKSGRGVPDVAATAAANPGYAVILDGQRIVKDGTSAAAPLWAAIVALANARRKTPLGLVNSQLYARSDLFRSITQGDNRVGTLGYDAAPGLVWNACTGLGAPKGADIVAALAAI